MFSSTTRGSSLFDPRQHHFLLVDAGISALPGVASILHLQSWRQGSDKGGLQATWIMIFSSQHIFLQTSKGMDVGSCKKIVKSRNSFLINAQIHKK